jgi:hypothetical protein
MTFEKKCLIEPSDITAVQYECDKCHAANLVPIEKISPDGAGSIAMRACPYCQTPSGFQIGTREIQVFMEFNASLIQIAEVMAGRNLKMRLNIKCDE